MACFLSDNENAHQERKYLLKENKDLRDEIQEIALSSRLPLTCSNTSCDFDDAISLTDVELNLTSLSNADSSHQVRFDSRRPITSCLIEHPARVNFRNKYFERTNEFDLIEDNDKRLIGEIAFQLDRRILQHIFAPRKRLYGFTARNIKEKIEECALDCDNEKTRKTIKEQLLSKYEALMNYLYNYSGYNHTYHPIFSEILVNSFGVLRSKARQEARSDYEELKQLLHRSIEPKVVSDALTLLNSLVALSELDGNSLFV